MEDKKDTPNTEPQSESAPPPGQPVASAGGMDPKVVAILAYITIFGWIAAVVLNNPKKPLGSYHIRQALGIMLAWFAMAIIAIIPILGWIIGFIGMIALFVFWIIGLIGAIQGQQKPIPLIGERSQEWFKAL